LSRARYYYNGMSMRSLPFLTALIALALALPAAAAAPTWSQVDDKDGIRVYTRPIPGVDFDEFKGVTVVHARIEVLGMVLRDIPRFPDWFAECKEASVVEKFDDNNVILHFIQDAPWPVSDRDVVLKINTEVDYPNGRAVISMKAVDDSRVPPKPGRVRMKSMTGRFVLEYLSREKTRVTYVIRADPSGSLPGALANSASKGYPHTTLKGMRRVARRQKYVDLADASKDKAAIERLIAEGALSR